MQKNCKKYDERKYDEISSKSERKCLTDAIRDFVHMM